MGWGHKAIEIRSAETGHLDGVFMHKKAQKLKFLCERNDKVSCIQAMSLQYLFKSVGSSQNGDITLDPYHTNVTDLPDIMINCCPFKSRCSSHQFDQDPRARSTS